MGLVVCLAGQIGSGKSSVTRALGKALGWPATGFGDYLRCELTRRGGDPSSRRGLQDLGQQLIDSDPEGFCRAVLGAGDFTAGSDLLVDGVRHTDILRRLKRLVAPSRTKLIFLAIEEELRQARVMSRANGRPDEPGATAHQVEADLGVALPVIADAIVDAAQELPTVVSECLALVGCWRDAEA